MYTRKTKRRLLDLANVLEFDPRVKKHFNMNWYLESGTGKPDYGPSDARGLDIDKCGSTACALGWAGVMNPEISAKHTTWDAFTRDFFVTDEDGQQLLHDEIFENPELMEDKIEENPKKVAKAIREFVFENMKDL